MAEETFVGIDVCKARLDIAILPTGEILAVDNSAAGIAELLLHITGLSSPLITLEATGGLERPVALALQEAGFPVAVLNARQVRDFARASPSPSW